MDFNKWNPFWTACFGALACMIIIGNTLSISILLNRRLRKRPHYLLISLAFADLMVGLCAMPIYIAINFSSEIRKLVPFVASDAVDMFTGISSIFTLAVISLERLNAVARPLRHRQLTLCSYLVAMVTPWILSLLVTTTRVLLWLSLISIQHFTSVVIITLSAPFLISCFAYFVICRKRRNRVTSSFRQNQENRFSTTVFLITGAFFLTWMPFQVLNILVVKCVSCRNMPLVIVFLIKFLQFILVTRLLTSLSIFFGFPVIEELSLAYFLDAGRIQFSQEPISRSVPLPYYLKDRGFS